MKIKLYYILILACTVLPALINSAFAQDSAVPDYEVSDSERERIINSPGEGETRYIPPVTQSTTAHQTVSEDTVTVQSQSNPSIHSVTPATVTPPAHTKPEHPVKIAEKQQQPKGEDDTILSFNFLYYIIQKYKLQDIVE